MGLITSSCAVCGKSTFESVFPSTVDPSADPSAFYSSSRRRAGHLDIVRCVGCGLLLTSPRDDDATLARVYGGLRDVAYDAERENRRRTARAYVRFLESQVPQRGRLLDVGCATGTFAEVAHQAGWTVTGLEPSAWATARARERCPDGRFVVGLLEEADFPPASFDAVTLWDIMEHVPSPRDALQRIRRWLKDGGHLFLNVPNSRSAVARLMGRRWALLLREHLWYFDRGTLEALLRGSQFELVSTQTNRVHFSLANVLARMGQYGSRLGASARRLAASPLLDKVNVAFPIGEMRVAARLRSAVDKD
jgi:2-polyprenyl-3-methyl-5-hydroxy-6-metoxy-1,4-benzoquinol methylase